MDTFPWAHIINTQYHCISIYYSMGHTALKDLISWELNGLSHLCHCQVLLGPCQGAIWGDSPRGAVGVEPGQQQEPQVAQQPEEQQTAEGDDEWHVPRRARVQVLLSRHNSEARLLKQDNRSSSKLHSDTNITFHLAELLHPGPRALQRTGTGRWRETVSSQGSSGGWDGSLSSWGKQRQVKWSSPTRKRGGSRSCFNILY